jgi:hypothetical protein
MDLLSVTDKPAVRLWLAASAVLPSIRSGAR